MAAQPWAVLVCRFSDDVDPSKVLVKDLQVVSIDDANHIATVRLTFGVA